MQVQANQAVVSNTFLSQRLRNIYLKTSLFVENILMNMSSNAARNLKQIHRSPFDKFIHDARRTKTEGKEADSSCIAIKAFSNGRSTKVTTVVIEVGWVQNFTSNDGTGLLDEI